MKLSVKIIAGLAVLAIAVVAIAGSSSDSKAATGKIFVANEYSKVTNMSPAPSGYETRSTIYGTYPGANRLTETNSDWVKVIVQDSELNDPVETTASGAGQINVTGDTSPSGSNFIEAGPATPITITLTGVGLTAPISGNLAHVQANTKILGSVSGELNGTYLSITNFFSGSGLGDPFMTALVNVAIPDQSITVTYDTAPIGYAEVHVKSEIDPTGIDLTARETAVGSGTFVGYFRILPNSGTSQDGETDPCDPCTAPEARIKTNIGPITVSFVDSGNATRTTSVSIDTQAPVPNVTSPVSGSSTTSHQPTFAGTISEAGSGLHVDTIKVWIDQVADQDNDVDVWNSVTNTILPGALDLGVATSGAVDGDSAFSFSDEPSVELPLTIASPDHVVDWVIVATDLAGNTGVSDTDPTTIDVGVPDPDLPTVKIDQTDPNATTLASDHRTGLWWDGDEEVSNPVGIRLGFLDNLTNVQASDFAVTLDSGAVRTPVSVIVVNNASDFTVGDELLDTIGPDVESLVYLQMGEAVPSNDTPFVVLQDFVSDLAGNSISEFVGFVDGEAPVQDGIAPNLTVTLSGGSGVGSGSEGPSSLTSDDMTITIVSDESLSQNPVVQVYRSGATLELTPLSFGQGANTWTANYSVPGVPPDGYRVLHITSIDLANNSGTTGSNDTASTSAPRFWLDQSLASPDLIVGGGSSTTDQTRPAMVVDYSADEDTTVTLMKVTLDGVDITSDVVPASDGKRFFYIPPADLSLGDHELKIATGDAHDAAGNSNTTDTKLTLTIEERKTFNIPVFAGWNAVSFPSDPIDPDINTVFNNVGHDAVLGWDPSVPGGWTVAVRDTVSGMLEPASEGGLTSVRSTQAYWVHANNFEDVKALLVGETLPGAGSPPGIVMLETVPGFNAIPVVDTDRKQTTGDAGTSLLRTPSDGGPDIPVTVGDYFGGNQGRVYKWNPATLNFELAQSSHSVNTGEVLFAEIPGGEPIFP